MPTLERAMAEEHPCELYAYHRPVPAITEFHHSKPVFLQNRLHGKIKHSADVWLCPTCHSNVHAWLDWLLKERRLEPKVSLRARKAAQETFDWYMREAAS